MQVKTKALVLSTLKYQDKSLIVRCYTQEMGIQSFFVRNAFTKSKSGLSIAYFQPLTLLEIGFDFKNKGGLEYFKEVRLSHPYQTICYDFSKSNIAIFLSEILSNSIREEQIEESLFTFLEASLLWLDTHDSIANFHLLFLVELTKFLGFYPDCTGMEKAYFNCIDGRFSNYYDVGAIEKQETILFRRLLQHSFLKDQRIFNGKERNVLVDVLMGYYELHLSDFRKPKSLDVLKEVFSN